jgi:hypothetical protein
MRFIDMFEGVDFGNPFDTVSFGPPVLSSLPPQTLTATGPHGVELIADPSLSLTIETLLNVRT